MTTKQDATALPDELAAELAALAPKLQTFEARRDAIDGKGGLRSKYNTRLAGLRRTHALGDRMCGRIGQEISNKLDTFMLSVLPPPSSGQYVGYPRNQ